MIYHRLPAIVFVLNLAAPLVVFGGVNALREFIAMIFRCMGILREYVLQPLIRRFTFTLRRTTSKLVRTRDERALFDLIIVWINYCQITG